jgi:hypothetical protein
MTNDEAEKLVAKAMLLYKEQLSIEKELIKHGPATRQWSVMGSGEPELYLSDDEAKRYVNSKIDRSFQCETTIVLRLEDIQFNLGRNKP